MYGKDIERLYVCTVCMYMHACSDKRRLYVCVITMYALIWSFMLDVCMYVCVYVCMDACMHMNVYELSVHQMYSQLVRKIALPVS